ncbi:bifunctional 2-C-methyl-D-erythritol 4-phosphate cytidylyltransferase/2-C-methyl-D-erythritol 2,4-cyclodiphosphate synthase [Sneathiella marina]|uniref:Bifunctional enzyme IspD/IspF n=1 Tax=Sneathiella marina TaxID=2950108 RepID=A0ABY4VXC3_9PROT|nr:bifunctional 2-C-methyl-D-erythritol 4-phosphate cytidylyltransferase/2-C-methyl-D-erythritol 2,4-cyclodiphosphate synthase [Sneathiella marina]USG59578.1 bifunctional 2-C-methyl-D-erythritol 4-phosphate cytidylyltransferase/2-C-methyl-D-erythritol 2,4-cyclodiphosphate synthase [Sneathiella marina]
MAIHSLHFIKFIERIALATYCQPMTTIALIVAAGRGHRTGRDLPKQYIDIAGKTVLARTVDTFLNHSGIDKVCVVIHADDAALYAAALADRDVLPWVTGGESRQASVKNGLEALTALQPSRVLIHDAARPFVSKYLIDRCILALEACDAVLPAVPLTDSLKFVAEDRVTGALDRDKIMAAQTPQSFRFDPILAAHRAFSKMAVTDDVGLAELADIPVQTVAGEPGNFKITTADDVARAEKMITEQLTDTRTGQGFDVHAFVAGRDLWLGGVKIPHDRGLKGHSDADVALHAVTDALLGAIAAGDIGVHFPPSDDRWRNVQSHVFLSHAGDLIAAKGGRISHIDLTIICEEPKINPYRAAMSARISEILGIVEDRVSVKGTTTEKLGFTGRREGIAAQAIATVRLPE